MGAHKLARWSLRDFVYCFSGLALGPPNFAEVISLDSRALVSIWFIFLFLIKFLLKKKEEEGILGYV